MIRGTWEQGPRTWVTHDSRSCWWRAERQPPSAATKGPAEGLGGWVQQIARPVADAFAKMIDVGKWHESLDRQSTWNGRTKDEKAIMCDTTKHRKVRGYTQRKQQQNYDRQPINELMDRGTLGKKPDSFSQGVALLNACPQDNQTCHKELKD